jgi:hypothetical protein
MDFNQHPSGIEISLTSTVFRSVFTTGKTRRQTFSNEKDWNG